VKKWGNVAPELVKVYNHTLKKFNNFNYIDQMYQEMLLDMKFFNTTNHYIFSPNLSHFVDEGYPCCGEEVFFAEAAAKDILVQNALLSVDYDNMMKLL
jgi:hypothetical protein